MTTALQQAVTAIKSGDKATGRQLLTQVIQADPNNEIAWLWMSGLADSDTHRRQCLEQVLAINPNNKTAQKDWRY